MTSRSDVAWQLRAACRGQKSVMFFAPAQGERRREKRKREQFAKDICDHCPVGAECREYALTVREQYGIWGGLTEGERRTRASV
ncbi:MAG: WhiB family transcriptional regulator [Acidimicrobiales bacterium]